MTETVKTHDKIHDKNDFKLHKMLKNVKKANAGQTDRPTDGPTK